MKFIVLVTDLEDIDDRVSPSAYRFPTLSSARSFIEECERAAKLYDFDMKFEIAKTIDLEVY